MKIQELLEKYEEKRDTLMEELSNESIPDMGREDYLDDLKYSIGVLRHVVEFPASKKEYLEQTPTTRWFKCLQWDIRGSD